MSKNNLVNFLSKYKSNTECNVINITGGKYNIPLNEYEEFLKLYNKCIEDKHNLHLLELRTENSLLFIDYDFKLNSKYYIEGDRLYNDKTINTIKDNIDYVFKSICDDIIPYNIYVFEKSKVIENDDYIKDGLHFCITNIKSKSFRKIFIDELMKITNLRYNDYDYIKNPLDKASVSCNWFLYGSHKENDEPYLYSKKYNISNTNLTYQQYINYFSNNLMISKRQVEPDNLKMKEQNEIEKFDDIECINKYNDQLKTYNFTNTTNDAISLIKPYIKEFLDILNVSTYCDDFNLWFNVCVILQFQFDDHTHELKEYFSKKSKKYNVSSNFKKYNEIKKTHYKDLRYKSLLYYCIDSNKYETIKLMKKCNLLKDDTNNVSFVKNFYNDWSDREKADYINNKLLNNRLKATYISYKKDLNSILYIFNEELKFYEAIRNKKLLSEIAHKFKTYIYDELLTKEEKQQHEVEIIIKKFLSASYYNHIVDELISINEDKEFNDLVNIGNPYEITMRNGLILDIETLTTRERTKNDLFTSETPVKYITNYDNTIEKKFLMELMNEDDEKYKYLLRVLGYLLVGSNELQSFFVFHGGGANGKSALLSLLNKIMGDYIDEASSDLFIYKEGGASRGQPELETLRKHRVVMYQETNETDKLNVSLIKKVSSGNDIINFRQLFSNEFNKMYSKCKLLLSCNDIPKFNTVDKAILRRMKYINFKSTFVNGDPSTFGKYEYKINERITEQINLDVLFSMIVEQSHEYVKIIKGKIGSVSVIDGFLQPPECVKNDFNQLIYDRDTFKQYMDEELIFTNNYNDILKLSEVYENYKMYIHASGGEHIGRNKFIVDIKKRKDIERYLKGGENKHAYKLCCFKFNYGDDKNDLDI
jgi:P4 family phage/plasmid primase-like protien